ncbi:MAG: NUDIX hydrolase [Candidatus Promineifilaceae bacterium]
MSKSRGDSIRLILAAGGLLWRVSDQGRQILIVHRQRYDDWTLPKGKLDKGESWEEAALREVEEETGCPASIDQFAGIVSYTPGGRPKVVLFFHMSPSGKCKEFPMGPGMEVDAFRWVTIPEAVKILSYEAERNLLLRESEETSAV